MGIPACFRTVRHDGREGLFLHAGSGSGESRHTDTVRGIEYGRHTCHCASGESQRVHVPDAALRLPYGRGGGDGDEEQGRGVHRLYHQPPGDRPHAGVLPYGRDAAASGICHVEFRPGQSQCSEHKEYRRFCGQQPRDSPHYRRRPAVQQRQPAGDVPDLERFYLEPALFPEYRQQRGRCRYQDRLP